MTFRIETGDAFARFVFHHDGGGFIASDASEFFSRGVIPNLSRRGWIKQTGIKKRVRYTNGKVRRVNVWEITEDGRRVAEYLIRRESGL